MFKRQVPCNPNTEGEDDLQPTRQQPNLVTETSTLDEVQCSPSKRMRCHSPQTQCVDDGLLPLRLADDKDQKMQCDSTPESCVDEPSSEGLLPLVMAHEEDKMEGCDSTFTNCVDGAASDGLLPLVMADVEEEESRSLHKFSDCSDEARVKDNASEENMHSDQDCGIEGQLDGVTDPNASLSKRRYSSGGNQSESNSRSPPLKVYPLRHGRHNTEPRVTFVSKNDTNLSKQKLKPGLNNKTLKGDQSSVPENHINDKSTLLEPSVVVQKLSDATMRRFSTEELPLHDKIAQQIKAQSLARSSPSEEGPSKCPKCKRLYRTKESLDTHVQGCNFEVSSGEEDEEEEDESESMQEKEKSKKMTVEDKVSDVKSTRSGRLRQTPSTPPKKPVVTPPPPGVKRGRGRPRKYPLPVVSKTLTANIGSGIIVEVDVKTAAVDGKINSHDKPFEESDLGDGSVSIVTEAENHCNIKGDQNTDDENLKNAKDIQETTETSIDCEDTSTANNTGTPPLSNSIESNDQSLSLNSSIVNNIAPVEEKLSSSVDDLPTGGSGSPIEKRSEHSIDKSFSSHDTDSSIGVNNMEANQTQEVVTEVCPNKSSSVGLSSAGNMPIRNVFESFSTTMMSSQTRSSDLPTLVQQTSALNTTSTTSSTTTTTTTAPKNLKILSSCGLSEVDKSTAMVASVNETVSVKQIVVNEQGKTTNSFISGEKAKDLILSAEERIDEIIKQQLLAPEETSSSMDKSSSESLVDNDIDSAKFTLLQSNQNVESKEPSGAVYSSQWVPQKKSADHSNTYSSYQNCFENFTAQKTKQYRSLKYEPYNQPVNQAIRTNIQRYPAISGNFHKTRKNPTNDRAVTNKQALNEAVASNKSIKVISMSPEELFPSFTASSSGSMRRNIVKDSQSSRQFQITCKAGTALDSILPQIKQALAKDGKLPKSLISSTGEVVPVKIHQSPETNKAAQNSRTLNFVGSFQVDLPPRSSSSDTRSVLTSSLNVPIQPKIQPVNDQPVPSSSSILQMLQQSTTMTVGNTNNSILINQPNAPLQMPSNYSVLNQSNTTLQMIPPVHQSNQALHIAPVVSCGTFGTIQPPQNLPVSMATGNLMVAGRQLQSLAVQNNEPVTVFTQDPGMNRLQSILNNQQQQIVNQQVYTNQQITNQQPSYVIQQVPVIGQSTSQFSTPINPQSAQGTQIVQSGFVPPLVSPLVSPASSSLINIAAGGLSINQQQQPLLSSPSSLLNSSVQNSFHGNAIGSSSSSHSGINSQLERSTNFLPKSVTNLNEESFVKSQNTTSAMSSTWIPKTKVNEKPAQEYARSIVQKSGRYAPQRVWKDINGVMHGILEQPQSKSPRGEMDDDVIITDSSPPKSRPHTSPSRSAPVLTSLIQKPSSHSPSRHEYIIQNQITQKVTSPRCLTSARTSGHTASHRSHHHHHHHHHHKGKHHKTPLIKKVKRLPDGSKVTVHVRKVKKKILQLHDQENVNPTGVCFCIFDIVC